MIWRAARMLLCAAIGALSACGQNLGTYSLAGLSKTDDLPEAFKRSSGYDGHYGQFLRVELESSANINEFDTGSGLYADAGDCPIQKHGSVVAFGPFDLSGEEVGAGHSPSQLEPANDGFFHYLVYLVTAVTAQTGPNGFTPYDLSRERKDMCLRLYSPGYHITPSRSHTVRIPAAEIARALR